VPQRSASASRISRPRPPSPSPRFAGLVGLEAEAAVGDLDLQPGRALPDAQVDRVIGAGVLDAVRDHLGDEKLRVADDAAVDIR
jgi:hypothetical protein